MIGLDEQIRGSIEHRIEDELESSIINEDNKWVFDTIPISSKKDFLLGFTIGKLMYLAWTIFVDKNYDPTDTDLKEVREIISRRLQEIAGRIIIELNI